jgi:hypothetical protein
MANNMPFKTNIDFAGDKDPSSLDHFRGGDGMKAGKTNLSRGWIKPPTFFN